MIEMWPFLKTTLEVIIAPILGLIVWVFKGYTDQVKSLEIRVTSLEKETARDIAVIKEKLSSMDKTLDKRLEKMETQIQKLVDKQ
jgi:hypothetical protein